MKFSMTKAAKEIGVSKSTMHRYIKSGRLSGEMLENGGYEIDASELMRAFPPGWKKRRETGSETPDRDDTEPHETVNETPNETTGMQAEIKILREMLERMDIDRDRERREAAATIEDYRRRLDQEGEERRALNARLLTYQQSSPGAVPQPMEQAPAKRGLFAMFRRTG